MAYLCLNLGQTAEDSDMFTIIWLRPRGYSFITEDRDSSKLLHVGMTTHDVSHHMYADDTQVYLELSQSDTHKSISSLSDCLTDISLWMKSSKT